MKYEDVKSWLARLVSGNPHFVIGMNNPDGPYMFRWYLIPRNHYLNLYLHKFLRDDDDRALHDHPWWFVSIIIHGRYSEIIPPGEEIKRHRFSIAFRPAIWRHRVILKTKTVWSIVLTGPKIRTWGFWCPQGFVRWQDFTAPNATGKSGEIGRGCE